MIWKSLEERCNREGDKDGWGDSGFPGLIIGILKIKAVENDGEGEVP